MFCVGSGLILYIAQKEVQFFWGAPKLSCTSKYLKSKMKQEQIKQKNIHVYLSPARILRAFYEKMDRT
jgi:hypothetical protein